MDNTGSLAVRRGRKKPQADPTIVGCSPLKRFNSSCDEQATGAVPKAPARTAIRIVFVLVSSANSVSIIDHHQYSNIARIMEPGTIAIAMVQKNKKYCM